MGVLVQIRNVPESMRAELKARARREGLSLNSYLLRLLDRDAAQPTVEEIVAGLAARGDNAQDDRPTTAEMIRDLREERDRELMDRFDARHR